MTATKRQQTRVPQPLRDAALVFETRRQLETAIGELVASPLDAERADEVARALAAVKTPTFTRALNRLAPKPRTLTALRLVCAPTKEVAQ